MNKTNFMMLGVKNIVLICAERLNCCLRFVKCNYMIQAFFNQFLDYWASSPNCDTFVIFSKFCLCLLSYYSNSLIDLSKNCNAHSNFFLFVKRLGLKDLKVLYIFGFRHTHFNNLLLL